MLLSYNLILPLSHPSFKYSHPFPLLNGAPPDQILAPGGVWSWHLPPKLTMSEMQHLTDSFGHSSGSITVKQGGSGLYAVHATTSGPGGLSTTISQPFYLENPVTAVEAQGGAPAVMVQRAGFTAPGVALGVV